MFNILFEQEDPWNAILSGTATGGILAARAGIKAAARSGIAGGVILAAIEGLNLVLTRVLMPSMEQQQAQLEGGVPVDPLLPPVDPSRPRVNRRTQPKVNWDSNPAPSPLFPSFSSDPAPLTQTWEPQGFSVDSFNSQGAHGYDSAGGSSEATPEDSGSSKSSWKFW